MPTDGAIEQCPGSLDTIVELSDVSVEFDMDRGRARVLNGVDIRIGRGEILGIVGESGSGKSMCASAILDAVEDPGVLTGTVTYHPPNSDPIEVLEQPDEELRKLRWDQISFLVQAAQSAFNPTMSMEDHFLETIRMHNADIDDRMDHARKLLSEVYLEPDQVLQSYPHELSGGMKQRTLLALSLLLEPEILVMDEPTAALDLLMQRSMISLLETLHEKYDLTMVFITHDLDMVADLADRIAVMYAFDFVEIGPTESVQRHPAHPYTRALFKATPSIDTPVEDMKPIPGSSPDPVDVPTGCSYHPRCPLAEDQCTAERPNYDEIGDRHVARCFYWEESSTAIPLPEVVDEQFSAGSEVSGGEIE